MITKEEALRLIETAIKGQGNQVDVGSVLPQVLETAIKGGGGGIDLTPLLIEGTPMESTLDELGTMPLFFYRQGKAQPLYMASSAYDAYLLRLDVLHATEEQVNMHLFVQKIAESDGKIVLAGEEAEFPLHLESNEYEVVDISGTTIEVDEEFEGTKQEVSVAMGITEAQLDAILNGKTNFITRGTSKVKLTSYIAKGPGNEEYALYGDIVLTEEGLMEGMCGVYIHREGSLYLVKNVAF